MIVTIWELFSYGETPFAGIHHLEVCQKVYSGYRLKAPKDCPENIYKLLLECWKFDPSLRPSNALNCMELMKIAMKQALLVISQT